MNGYIIYKDLDSENYIVEILNINDYDIHYAQKDLVNKGFIICSMSTMDNDKHICMRVRKLEEKE